jgi:hypothetical protein
MFTCTCCKEKDLDRDEVMVHNCNGEVVASDEQSLERNAQNPDYAVVTICSQCYEYDSVHQALEAMKHTGKFVPPSACPCCDRPGCGCSCTRL